MFAGTIGLHASPPPSIKPIPFEAKSSLILSDSSKFFSARAFALWTISASKSSSSNPARVRARDLSPAKMEVLLSTPIGQPRIDKVFSNSFTRELKAESRPTAFFPAFVVKKSFVVFNGPDNEAIASGVFKSS
jgi:hypothetical protein